MKKKFAFINRVGELKITEKFETAQEYAPQAAETTIELFKQSGNMVTGNPSVDGVELFVDKDGIRVGEADTKEKSFDTYPTIKETYEYLKSKKK